MGQWAWTVFIGLLPALIALGLHLGNASVRTGWPLRTPEFLLLAVVLSITTQQDLAEISAQLGHGALWMQRVSTLLLLITAGWYFVYVYSFEIAPAAAPVLKQNISEYSFVFAGIIAVATTLIQIKLARIERSVASRPVQQESR